MEWISVEYETDKKGNIFLDETSQPFDGSEILVKFGYGCCSAWWCKGEKIETIDGTEYDGWIWVCCDDKFQLDFEEVTHWMPLPDPPKE